MRPLHLLLALLFCSCVSHPPRARYSAPNVTPVKTSVQDATTQVKATRTHVAKAKADVATAADEVRVIIGDLPSNLRPQGETLQATLAAASQDLVEADNRAELAEKTLDTARLQTVALAERVEEQTAQLNTETDAKNQALADLSKTRLELTKQTKLAWKWRLISLAVVAMMVGFFIARQYFPFLKIL